MTTSIPEVTPPTTTTTTSDHVLRTRICIGIAVLTFLTFLPTLLCDFVRFDDNILVYENPIVRSGLTVAGIRHVLTTFDVGYPIPVTMLSLMLDTSIYGLDQPWGFHLTNVIVHTVNSVLLFTILRAMTGSAWRSAAVAAVWAVHPLRVESVAWVTERKDVLAALFGLLCVRAYHQYASELTARRYLPVVVMFVLSLLSKPMLLPLPAMLVLIDVWPLGRIKGWANS
jgi:protein O-mannosyl-transferase